MGRRPQLAPLGLLEQDRVPRLGAADSPESPVVDGLAVEGVQDGPVLGEPLAEAAVLGCLLRATPPQATGLLELLRDDDFTVPQHAHVAAAARALLAQGSPVDPVTVLGQLRRQGTEDARTASRDAGVLLIELCQAAPCTSNAGHYARVVLEHAYRRRAQQAGVRLLQAAASGSLEDLHALAQAEHTALAAAHRRATRPSPAARPA